MTIKTLCVAVLLICCYAIVVSTLPPGLERKGFGQKDNIVKVENVLYRAHVPHVLLVGSSLTALLKESFIPEDWANLAINAGSALTGIEIIKRSSLRPQIVVVEVNMLMRAIDNELLSEVYAQPMHSLRDFFPVLRIQNHPGTLLFSIIQKVRGEGINVRSEDKFNLGLTYQKKSFATALPDGITKARLNDLLLALEALRQRGITIYLIRYPMSTEVAALPQMKNWIHAVSMRFKTPEYNWIEVPPDSEFTTTDSLHIDTEGAVRMVKILKAHLESSPTPGERKFQLPHTF